MLFGRQKGRTQHFLFLRYVSTVRSQVLFEATVSNIKLMERVQEKQLLDRRSGCREIPSEPSPAYVLNTLEPGLLLDCGDGKIIKPSFCS